TTINRNHKTDSNVSEVISNALKDVNLDSIEVASGGKEDDVSVEALRELVEEAPIVRLANLIISRGCQDGASDIHVEPGRAGVRVRYRVDGILQDAQVLPKKVQASLISRIKIMAEMDIAEKRCPQDGRIGLRSEERRVGKERRLGMAAGSGR